MQTFVYLVFNTLPLIYKCLYVSMAFQTNLTSCLMVNSLYNYFILPSCLHCVHLDVMIP